MKHNPNFCCACGNHIKEEEWIKILTPLLHYKDPKETTIASDESIQLRMCPNCKCVQGE